MEYLSLPCFTLTPASYGYCYHLYEQCKGEVVYHAFETRNKEEAAANRAKIDKREATKAERKAIQTANVERKAAARAAKLEARKQRREQRAAALEEDESGSDEEESVESDADDESGSEEEGERSIFMNSIHPILHLG